MPNHPLADRDTVTFSELGRYPIIARSNPVGFNSWIREIKKLNRTDLQENANMSFNAWLHEGYRLRFPFLINNFGISTVWDNVKDLVTIPVSGKYTERDIYLYYQENENEGVRELLDIIKENAASTTKADRALGF